MSGCACECVRVCVCVCVQVEVRKCVREHCCSIVITNSFRNTSLCSSFFRLTLKAPKEAAATLLPLPKQLLGEGILNEAGKKEEEEIGASLGSRKVSKGIFSEDFLAPCSSY